MIIRIRSTRVGAGIREQVFVASAPETTFQLAGELVWNDVGEWQLFGAALLLGARVCAGHLKVILEGDDAVVGASAS